jgi:hemerythrin-like metal-binding protein
MQLIEWDEEKLGVGVELIDNQHKMLIHIINQLSKAIDCNDTTVITNVFTQLYDYTEYHFSTEETCFGLLNNKDTDIHISQHRNFINKLTTIKDKYNKEKTLPADLLLFLTDWLVKHIQIEDRKFIK